MYMPGNKVRTDVLSHGIMSPLAHIMEVATLATERPVSYANGDISRRTCINRTAVVAGVDVGEGGEARWKPLTRSTVDLHVAPTCKWPCGDATQVITLYGTPRPTKYTWQHRATCKRSLLCVSVLSKSEEDMVINCTFPQMSTGAVVRQTEHERVNLFVTLHTVAHTQTWDSLSRHSFSVLVMVSCARARSKQFQESVRRLANIP